MSDTPPPPPPYGSYPPQQPPQPPQQPPPAPPYGAPQYGGPLVPDHPQATTVLVLGIVGIVACGIAAPFAWVMGNRVLQEIDDSGGRIGGRSNANAGRICGIIGSVLLAISLVFFIGLIGIAILGVATATTSP